MFSYWMDMNDPFRAFDDLRRRMDQIFRDYDTGPGYGRSRGAAFPRVNLRDTGTAFELRAEVPGLTEKELQITASADSLSISGERKSIAPEGYTTHRQERGTLKFARSFALPARIDVEKVTAQVKNGVLAVNMPKHPESQPKSITVKAS